MPLFGDIYGNPNSQHSFGQKTRHEIELARETVSKMLGCKPEQLIFNSGATEGNATAIYAALQALPDRKHIITTAVEHSSVLEIIRHMAESGYRVTELEVDRLGRIDLEQLKNEISGDTALVSAMWANNETGVINPLSAIGDIAKQFGALFHVDAVQAAGKIKIDLAEHDAIDYLTLSGHKFHGLKGAGVLFVRDDTVFQPFIRGGHQESGKRAGTENTLGIVAMGAAAGLINRGLYGFIEKMKLTRNTLQEGLLAEIEDVVINGDETERLPNTLNIGFKYIDGEALLMMMDAENIAVSAGSACQSGSMEPSYVLKAMNTPLDAIHGSLRFCTSRFTEDKEVQEVIKKTTNIVKRLREMSPYTASKTNDYGRLEKAELETHRQYFALK